MPELQFVFITQAKLQSTAYWYRWFVKVQVDIFVTCDLDGKCGPLTETVGFLLEPYEGKGYQLYQDYYNSVHQMNELLQKLMRVCGTIRVNRGLPKDVIEEAKKLKKGEVTFRRNQEILL